MLFSRSIGLSMFGETGTASLPEFQIAWKDDAYARAMSAFPENQ